ncbi:MAG: methyl-accepting chemotaxis protein [Eubacterium sp.]|nr:methyl-accepting chemotaxis protein [Eubacterium sp.]
MTESQYRRANRTVLSIVVIILAYFISIMGLTALTSQGDSQPLFRTLISVLMLIGTIVFYVLWKKQKKGAVAMMICATVAYAVIVLFGTGTGVYAYAFPVLFGAMAYYNRKLLYMGNGAIIVINLIRIFLIDQSQLSDAIMGLLTIALVAYASCAVSKLLTQFNTENINTVAEAAAKQEESQQKMLQVAASIIDNFDGAMGKLTDLQGNVDTSNFAMTNIAESTDATAQSIQRQADMCMEIRSNTDAAEASMRSLIEASDRTNDMVVQGAEVVEHLRKQAQNVEEASGATVEVSNRLSGKVEEVQNFIGAILSISSQTNLLALNASIEAARAGEAGKGFAVVAEEIRQLSEQTKDASNSITNIINELIQDTKSVNESVERAVVSVTKQSELIEATKEKFESVDTEVQNMVQNVRSCETTIASIIDSTNAISDDISQLSATSEEVAASSVEGLRTSDATVQNMQDCKEMLEEIFNLAKQLQ